MSDRKQEVLGHLSTQSCSAKGGLTIQQRLAEVLFDHVLADAQPASNLTGLQLLDFAQQKYFTATWRQFLDGPDQQLKPLPGNQGCLDVLGAIGDVL